MRHVMLNASGSDLVRGAGIDPLKRSRLANLPKPPCRRAPGEINRKVPGFQGLRIGSSGFIERGAFWGLGAGVPNIIPSALMSSSISGQWTPCPSPMIT